MRNGMKIKLAVTVLLLSGMLCSGATAYAGSVSRTGDCEIPFFELGTKETSDRYSNLTLGDIIYYDQLQACTHSYVLEEKCFVQSNPLTVCYENSTTYLGQYVSVKTYAGQEIRLFGVKRDGVTERYFVNSYTWDYR